MVSGGVIAGLPSAIVGGHLKLESDMAHFYGTQQGNRRQVQRCGTKSSGFTAFTASWEGAVRVEAWYDASLNEDWVEVHLCSWLGNGADPSIKLYRGPISGIPEQIARRMEK